MKQKMILLFSIFIMSALLSSCMSTGAFVAHNVTSVEMTNPKAKIVARDIEGTSEAGYIFGVTYSAGFIANTFALARVSGSGKIYNDAIRDIWKNYEEKYGSIEGKKLVLTNIRYDNDILNLFPLSDPRLNGSSWNNMNSIFKSSLSSMSFPLSLNIEMYCVVIACLSLEPAYFMLFLGRRA